jgi:hypothetical protein
VSRIQLGKTLYHQGDLSYFEAVNKETLKNSYQRFEEEGIMQVVKSKDTRVPPRLRIAPEWRPGRDEATGRLRASGRLWDFTEKIASSRREGKNRRDGATVSTRVVSLTDELGGKLFADAVRGEEGKGKAVAPARLSDEEEKSLSRSVREKKRRRRLEGRAHL